MKFPLSFWNDGHWKKTVQNILDMSLIDAKVWEIIHSLTGECEAEGYAVTIVSVIYEPGAFGSKTMTHPQGRATDADAIHKDTGRPMPFELGRQIADRVCRRFPDVPYGMKVCVWHKVEQGYHFHLQWPRRPGFELDDQSSKAGCLD